MFPCSSCCFPNSEQARLCGHCGLYLKPIGDYNLTGQIGTGGFADVYRAINRYTGHAAAIKLLHSKLHNDKEVEQRFLREVEILKDMRSPNVVQIYDFGTLKDLGLYLVMEWLDGKTLDVYLHEQVNQRLPFQDVVPLFSQLLYGLSHIHEQKVVHRDLKPKNFMVLEEGQKRTLKILDFGIAWRPNGKDLTERGMFVGSTYFMSPEQFKAQKEYFGAATDLYVAGQLLVWMLTGKHVFTANTLQALAIKHCVEQPPSLSELCPELPFAPELEALVTKALQKKAANRYQTAMDFLAEFQKIVPLQMQAMQKETPSSFAATQPTLQPPSFATPHIQPTPFAEKNKADWGRGLHGGNPNQQAIPQGNVLLKSPSLQPRNAPPLASMPFPQLAAPNIRELRQPNIAQIKQTPLMPLKAVHQQVHQHDSMPAEMAEQPIRIFQRKTTSVEKLPRLNQQKGWKKWFLWGLLTTGISILFAGTILFALPFFGLGIPLLPVYTPPAPRHAPARKSTTTSFLKQNTHKQKQQTH